MFSLNSPAASVEISPAYNQNSFKVDGPVLAPPGWMPPQQTQSLRRDPVLPAASQNTPSANPVRLEPSTLKFKGYAKAAARVKFAGFSRRKKPSGLLGLKSEFWNPGFPETARGAGSTEVSVQPVARHWRSNRSVYAPANAACKPTSALPLLRCGIRRCAAALEGL